jgi:Tfp pilus assembly protein FimT
MKTRSGLTILELLITFGLMVIILVVSIQALGGYQRAKYIPLTANEIATVLQSTQKRAITQEKNTRWGVRFSNATGTQPDTYSVFWGASYAPANVDQTITLKRNTQFSEPTASSTYDVVFDPITGFLSAAKVISIIDLKNVTGVGDIIVNRLGRVTVRTESGLVGYWHFDEGTGTVTADVSGNANAGSLVGGPTWQAEQNCRAGKCLNFAGSQYVNVGTSSSLTSQSITLEAWVRASSFPSGWNGIISNMTSWGTGFGLQIGTTQNIAAMVSGAYLTTSWTPTTGVWYHIAATHDAADNLNVLYVNGDAESSTTRAVTYEANPKTYIGTFYTSPNLYFFGLIDEVRIYNRALSASEIAAHYNDLK